MKMNEYSDIHFNKENINNLIHNQKIPDIDEDNLNLNNDENLLNNALEEKLNHDENLLQNIPQDSSEEEEDLQVSALANNAETKLRLGKILNKLFPQTTVIMKSGPVQNQVKKPIYYSLIMIINRMVEHFYKKICIFL